MITVFTDGSCVCGNPGNAACAYIAMRDDVMLDAIGIPMGRSTNNRGELNGIIHGLLAAAKLAFPCEDVLLVTDSMYGVDGIWKARNNAMRRVANHDLWNEIADAVEALVKTGHALQIKWVRGHNGNPGNTRCDRLARNTARTQMQHTSAMVLKKDCLVSSGSLV